MICMLTETVMYLVVAQILGSGEMDPLGVTLKWLWCSTHFSKYWGGIRGSLSFLDIFWYGVFTWDGVVSGVCLCARGMADIDGSWGSCKWVWLCVGEKAWGLNITHLLSWSSGWNGAEFLCFDLSWLCESLCWPVWVSPGSFFQSACTCNGA